MRKRQVSEEVKLKREELVPGIYLEHYQKKVDDKNVYLLKVESQSFKIMDLTIDLTESKNIEIQGSSEYIKKLKVEPFTKATVVKILLGKKWAVSPKFYFKMSNPPLETQRQLIRPYNQELDEKIASFKAVDHIDYKALPWEASLGFLSQRKVNFIDTEFPPTSASLCSDSLFFESKHKFIHQWRRGKYLYYPPQKANQSHACPPVLFSHQFRSTVLHSIKQSSSAKIIDTSQIKNSIDAGFNILDMEYIESEKQNLAFLSDEGVDPGVGTHEWMTVALMAIKNYPELLRSIFITSKPNPQGLYLLRLHLMGRKSVMQLDDYIPCIPFDGPIFLGKNSEAKPDFGFFLLEKAFAKRRGSYEKLKFGSVTDCLVDLTGAPVLEIPLADYPEPAAEELWKLIEEWMAERYIIIVEQSTSTDEGLSSSMIKHSHIKYAKTDHFILTAAETDDNDTKIVRLRMKPQKLTKIETQDADEHIRQPLPAKRGVLEPTGLIGVDLSPNELPVPFTSFCKNFQKIILAKSTFKEKLRLKGKFVSRSMTERAQVQKQNLISRWYYRLELKHPTNLTIGLHQEDENWIGVKETRPPIDLGLVVLKEGKQGLSLRHYLPSTIKRQVFLDMKLEAGMYIVLPLSIGIYNKDESFKLGISSHDSKNPIVVSVVQDIFEKLNMSGNDFLAYAELKNFYKSINLGTLSQADFQKLITKYSTAGELGVKEPNGLSEKAFIKHFFHLLEASKNKPDSLNFFEALGYDETLFSLASRIFTLTVHSNKFVDIDWKDTFKDSLESRIMGILLAEQGKKITTFKEDVDMAYPIVLANE